MRALLLAALLSAAVPSRAAPFDTYQLIMWQDHTPTEVQGLERLGFTATKLRATGGAIDPADLARHVSGGLPWYLENIATDFYAPYHRYLPGQPVNALFNAAVARHRADPADGRVFLREPSLSDPAWRERIQARLQAIAAAQSHYHPLFYNLADESGIGDLAAAWDFDLGPSSVMGFRAWLQTQYPSLPALNAEWDTGFERWDDVVPELTDAALARNDQNFAAWSDFKAWMDVAFDRAVRDGTDALHRADPAALAGLEGGQVPGWGGYDYFRLASAVDVMEVYDIGDSVALAHAANPALIVLRTSFNQGDTGAIWRSLLQGGRGTVVWDEDSVINPDGSPKPRGAELARVMQDIRPVAPVILASHPALDPVAVLVSQASFRVSWLLDRTPGGRAWSERDAARENEDNVWRASRRETLQRLGGLGVQPHLLSSEMLEGGALVQRGIKVLFLPHAIALSEAEVAAIRAFAASGGTVLADTEPGLFDGHGRHRAEAPLPGVAQIPDLVLRTGAAPDAGTLEGEAALLQKAGVVPRAEFRVSGGARAPGLEARWLVANGQELLSLQAISPYSAPQEVEIRLPEPRVVSDLRQGGAPFLSGQFHVQLDRSEPTILVLTK